MSESTRKTLLLVEDEAILAMTEKMELEKYGYAVKIVNTGEKAVEAVKTMPEIDLVLMDINLGKGLDGTEAAEIILKDHDIPIVFLSSHSEREVVEKTEKITSYGYVVKNSSIAVLDASIKMAFKLFETKTHAAESAEQYRAIVENTSDYIMRYDRNGRHLYGNPSALAVTGFTFGQFVGKTHSELGFTEELCILWEHAIENVFFTGLSEALEFEVDLEGGHAVLQLRLSPEFNAKGVVNSVIGISRDITALKRTEEDLRIHQIELQTQNDELCEAQSNVDALSLRHFDLYDLAPAGCLTLGETGLVLEANLSAAEILGVARSSLLKQPFTSFIEKADQDRYYHHRKKLFETGVPQHCDLRLRRQDGSVFNAYLKAVMSQEVDGAPVCRVALIECVKD